MCSTQKLGVGAGGMAVFVVLKLSISITAPVQSMQVDSLELVTNVMNQHYLWF